MIRTNAVYVWVLASAVSLLACKKDGGGTPDLKPAVTDVGTNDGTAVTKTIGSAGGAMASDDGEMELIIPPGALAANTGITIQPISNNAPNGRRKAYRCTPDGQQFAKDITIKFHYTDEDAAATEPEYMMVAFQKDDGTWQVLENVQNDEANNVISVYTNHFTDFTAFDIMRIEPASLYLKTNETGEYKVTAAGISQLNGVLLIGALLDRPETWKANGVTGGNSTYGTIVANANQTRGVYTAPATAPATNPVIISAEIDFPFVVDGQRFNHGILTAHAFIIGGRYAVDVETSNEMAIGTGEVFVMKDHARFTVNLVAAGGTVTDMQNSPATFQKTANSTAGCNTTIELSGTGPLNLRDSDVTGVTAFGGDVYVGFGTHSSVVNPKFLISCPGVTPKVNEVAIPDFSGVSFTFKDNKQVQVFENGANGQYVKYTVTALQ
jgi:hypothetical protein